MDAECARSSCAQQATLLLAYDPRGARAWLRDLVDAHPGMGLILCREHGEQTTVPMSWEFIDERSPDFDADGSGFDDEPVPSFDDIFPPRVAPEPDPYGLAGDELDIRQPAMTAAETEEAIANDPAMATLNLSDEDDLDNEAVELLAPELPASGTDGAGIHQPQLPNQLQLPQSPATQIPMIKTPPPGPGPAEPPFDPTPSASVAPSGIPGSSSGPASSGVVPWSPNNTDFLFVESPDESLSPADRHPANPTNPASQTGSNSSAGDPDAHRRTYTSPIFDNTNVSPQQLNVPPSATLLSRAFRTAQFD